jgi:ABC-2 type transport system permease protein
MRQTKLELHLVSHDQTPGRAPTQHIGGVRKFLIDVKYLWLEQILEVRTVWYWYAVFSLFMPLAMVFGFTRMGSGLADRASLIFIISGSAIFAVANDGLYTMAIRIGSMKKEGMLLYYASLPISKAAFIIAVMLSRLVITLPGMLVPMLFGALIYDVHLEFNLWIIVLLPLMALALSSIGMAFGSLINSLELIQIIVNMLLFVLVLAAPIFMPIQSLPLPLQILGYLLPPTYAADALRQALNGTIGPTFYIDMVVVTLMTLVSFYILNRWLRWQLK